MPKNKGFTLIELLIVLIIIGITISFALLAYGDFGASRRIQFAAEQLVHHLKLAQQQAILESGTLGIRIDNSSYQILRFKNNKQWMTISNKGIFKMVYFPEHTVINLKTSIKPALKSPSIVINSSGDMTPFTLNIGTQSNPTLAIILGKHNGQISLTAVKNK